METIPVQTKSHTEFVDITRLVQRSVEEQALQNGFVLVYVPHTTAGITINENADPTVVQDLLADLDRLVSWRQPYYRHLEGNSAAHTKTSLVGSSQQLIVEKGRLLLGRWQGIFLCEFDGPRSRRIFVECLSLEE